MKGEIKRMKNRHQNTFNPFVDFSEERLTTANYVSGWDHERTYNKSLQINLPETSIEKITDFFKYKTLRRSYYNEFMFNLEEKTPLAYWIMRLIGFPSPVSKKIENEKMSLERITYPEPKKKIRQIRESFKKS